LPLKVAAKGAGLAYAERQAKQVAVKLTNKTFDWTPYIKVEPQPELIKEWVEKFEFDYFGRCERNPKSEST